MDKTVINCYMFIPTLLWKESTSPLPDTGLGVETVQTWGFSGSCSVRCGNCTPEPLLTHLERVSPWVAATWACSPEKKHRWLSPTTHKAKHSSAPREQTPAVSTLTGGYCCPSL